MNEKEREILYWSCPYCEWKIPDIQYQSARYDYPCPQCRRRNLSDFVPHLKAEEEVSE